MISFKTFEQEDIVIDQDGNTVTAKYKNEVLQIKMIEDNDLCFVLGKKRTDTIFILTLEYLFNSHPGLKVLHFKEDLSSQLTREEFFQTSNLWHKEPQGIMSPELWQRDVERPHPRRSDRKDGLFYQRFVPSINKTITFRGIDPEADLDTFHRWHNSPRVSFFWELALEKKELLEYMIKTKNDPHMVPTFVEMNGVPVGYFEMYWTLEDRLGPYYPADAFDRGFHFLIGETFALGFQNTDSIVKSALHFLFLDDPRTRRVMAEPRHDNKKVLKYAESSGWVKLKEFDFPHKRAALLECKRENFFNGNRL